MAQPRSALNLRAALATFGLVSCAVLAGLSFALDRPAVAVLLIVIAGTAIVDLVVIVRRRGREPGQHPDLFS